jgi:eukaryotic-like serine/threonine-protein kinase
VREEVRSVPTNPSKPPPAPAPPPAPDPLIGRSLGGHYQISGLLGKGGMSRVYRAVQSPLQREVALKVLKDDPEDPSLKKRFLFEASVTAHLSHPNTITLFDYGADQGLIYFAMELLRGSTLSQVMRRDGRFSEQRALRVTRQVCRSLREAHAMGLVHRDLKPSNLFVVETADEPDFIKVLDFGLVKGQDQEQLVEHLTPGGSILGTPHYMAPEQARNLACDQRSDIYALGVVIYQMVTGRLPFEGGSTIDVLLKHATEPAPFIRTAFPELEISVELEAVVAKCLQKAAADRFQEMDELLAALPGEDSGRTKPPPEFRMLGPDVSHPGRVTNAARATNPNRATNPGTSNPGRGSSAGRSSLPPSLHPSHPSHPSQASRPPRTTPPPPPPASTPPVPVQAVPPAAHAPAPQVETTPQPRRPRVSTPPALAAMGAPASSIPPPPPPQSVPPQVQGPAAPAARPPPPPIDSAAPAKSALPKVAVGIAVAVLSIGAVAFALRPSAPTRVATTPAPPPVEKAPPAPSQPQAPLPATAVEPAAAAPSSAKPSAPEPASQRAAAAEPKKAAAPESKKTAAPESKKPTAPAKVAAVEIAARPKPQAAPAKASAASSAPSAESQEQLQEEAARVVSSVRQCAMLDARAGNATGASAIDLRITVDPSGAVTEVTLTTPGLGKSLEGCVKAAARKLSFEPFQGAPVTLSRSVALTRPAN